MARALSETRIRILRRLASRDLSREGAESAREIACGCGEGRRASDWAVGALREMTFHGLVRPLGITMSNARTWTITDAGREALAKAEASV
jgi:hypothetical protein